MCIIGLCVITSAKVLTLFLFVIPVSEVALHPI